MRKTRHLGIFSVTLCSMVVFLAGCGKTQALNTPAAPASVGQRAQTLAPDMGDEVARNQAEGSGSGLPAEVETYYKTMVYIEGTAQLMAKFDWASTTEDNQGVIMAMISIPGFMDNRVIATEETPLPPELALAWEKALQANDKIQLTVEDLLMTQDQAEFITQMGASENLASEAVTETEGILSSTYGATEESIAIANRVALTEMGEDFQTMASMFLVGKSQVDQNSE